MTDIRNFRICISCGGFTTVVDLGSGETRPCLLCRQDAYADWIRERQPPTRRIARLDEKGRCCGRKPLVYKKPQHRLFCCRCNAEIDPSTGIQVPNWAWVSDGEAFVATNPTFEYATLRQPPIDVEDRDHD